MSASDDIGDIESLDLEPWQQEFVDAFLTGEPFRLVHIPGSRRSRLAIVRAIERQHAARTGPQRHQETPNARA